MQVFNGKGWFAPWAFGTFPSFWGSKPNLSKQPFKRNAAMATQIAVLVGSLR